MAWSKAVDFYAFSCGSFRKKARNLIETAQRKSQLCCLDYIQAFRVASQALPDHPLLHKESSSGWENVATLTHAPF